MVYISMIFYDHFIRSVCDRESPTNSFDGSGRIILNKIFHFKIL